MVVRGARCLAGWVLFLADTAAQSTQPERRGVGREGSRQLSRQRSNLWRQAGVARHAGGRGVVWTASDRAFYAATGSQSPSATAPTSARSGWAARCPPRSPRAPPQLRNARPPPQNGV